MPGISSREVGGEHALRAGELPEIGHGRGRAEVGGPSGAHQGRLVKRDDDLNESAGGNGPLRDCAGEGRQRDEQEH